MGDIVWIVIVVVLAAVIAFAVRAGSKERRRLAGMGMTYLGLGHQRGGFGVKAFPEHGAMAFRARMHRGLPEPLLDDARLAVFFTAASLQRHTWTLDGPAVAAALDRVRSVVHEGAATWTIVHWDHFDTQPCLEVVGQLHQHGVTDGGVPRRFSPEVAHPALTEAGLALVDRAIRPVPTEDDDPVALARQAHVVRRSLTEVLAQYERWGVPHSTEEALIRAANAWEAALHEPSDTAAHDDGGATAPGGDA